MKLRQYRLGVDLASGKSRSMIVWLEDGRAKVGDSVTLKDYPEPDLLWEVKEAYSAADSKDLHGQNESDNWNKLNNI